MDTKIFLKKYLYTSSQVIEELQSNSVVQNLEQAVKEILHCYYKRGGSVFLFGNGGAALIAQHIAEELVGGFKIFNSKRAPLSANALSVDAAKITAIGNDFGFKQIFTRQLDPVLTSSDVVIAVSASGNSPNILEAVKFVHKRGATVIGLTGKSGGRLARLCNIVIKSPSDEVSVIQEAHTIIGHAICSAIEEGLFGKTLLHFE